MIIVTGGAGFIGSAFVDKLEKANHSKIVVCDKFGHDERWQNLKKRSLWDVVAPENIASFLKLNKDQIEIIYHMGANSSTTETNADLVMDMNFKFSKRLLEWCTRYSVRLVYASSAATYGDGSQGFSDFEREDDLSRFTPLNVYAWSKHLFDRHIAYLKKNNLALPPQLVGLKFFNVYGPNEYHKKNMMSVVKHVFDTVQKDEPARLFKSYRDDYEDGGQMRDFVWVKDCCDIMEWLYNKHKVNGLFNIGTGQARTFKDLAMAVFAGLEKEPNIEFVDMPEGLDEKYQYFTEAKMDKLKKAGYKKEMTSLEDGVREYVQQHLTQSDPYL